MKKVILISLLFALIFFFLQITSAFTDVFLNKAKKAYKVTGIEDEIKDKKEGQIINIKQVFPDEIYDVLVNPGMGFTTFHEFNGDTPGYPASSITYHRWYWKDVEPTKGNIRFDLIDDLIQTTTNHGQKLAFRIMATGDTNEAKGVMIPKWLYNEGVEGWLYGNPADTNFMPDFSDTNFMTNVHRVIKAFGEKYNGHPDIDHIDVGWIGHWGEWHVYQAEPIGVTMPSVDVQKKYIDWMLEAFPDTHVLMLIDGYNVFSYAVVEKKAGWRADGFGDQWHLETYYPPVIETNKAETVWKEAPVSFETYGVLQDMYNAGKDINYLIDYALNYHVSTFNNKSSPIPTEWSNQIKEFQKKMGYRFVIRSITLPNYVKTGEKITISSVWENIGVAPVYYQYEIAFRLREENSGNVISIWKSNTDIKKWIPGTYNVTIQPILSPSIAKGEYNLDAAIVTKGTSNPVIKLAISGKEDDGWYKICTINIE